jgi:hypothetical protein
VKQLVAGEHHNCVLLESSTIKGNHIGNCRARRIRKISRANERPKGKAPSDAVDVVADDARRVHDDVEQIVKNPGPVIEDDGAKSNARAAQRLPRRAKQEAILSC